MSRNFPHDVTKRLGKLSKKEQLDLIFDLINAFMIVKSPTDTALLLQDLLTASEIKNLARRLGIAKLIIAGETHREIINSLHCSFATVAKVKEWLDKGGEGLKKVIEKLPTRYTYPNKLPPGPIEYHLPQALLAVAQHSLYKSQTKRLEKFFKSTKDKERLDRSLQELFDEEYKKR